MHRTIQARSKTSKGGSASPASCHNVKNDDNIKFIPETTL